MTAPELAEARASARLDDAADALMKAALEVAKLRPDLTTEAQGVEILVAALAFRSVFKLGPSHGLGGNVLLTALARTLGIYVGRSSAVPVQNISRMAAEAAEIALLVRMDRGGTAPVRGHI